MTGVPLELHIERLGRRGEGLTRGPDAPLSVPYALAGETVVAEIEAGRGRLIEILTPSPERIEPFCPSFGECGGCAVQALAAKPYALWKEALLAEQLAREGLRARIEPLVDAHGEGRRRATFHARQRPSGRIAVGFMQARAHKIIEIPACPLLAPSMEKALPAARAIAKTLGGSGRPLDILVTATLTGLDIDLKGHGPLDEDETRRLVRCALALDLARLSNHGVVVAMPRAPLLAMGRAEVTPPPGAFLQATKAGEDLLAGRVCAAARGARKIADLFSGIGTFSLRMAEFAEVRACDSDAAALASLAKAARGEGFCAVSVEARDLFRRPLAGEDLSPFDAIVFDPPRAGAEQQARALAAARAPLVIAVSCNAQTFARDAAILCAGGYEIARIEPFDQFRHSPHIEIVGEFRRPAGKARRTRRLLG